MAKVQNQHIYSDSSEELNRLAEEFTFVGRTVRLENGHLTVFALPFTWKRKKEKERREANARDDKTGWDDSETER